MPSQPPRRRSSKRPYMPWDIFRRAPRSNDQRPAPPPFQQQRNTPRPAPPQLDPTQPTYPGAPRPQGRPMPPAPNDGAPPAGPGIHPRAGQSPPRQSPPGQFPSRQSPAGYPRTAFPQQADPRQPYPRQYLPAPRRRFSCSLGGCLFSLLALLALAAISAAYLLWPGRTNILLLGVDYADWWNWLARTDTIMLTTWIPSEKYVGILSVPRDLWVNIPGYGENRINTAHFFCEAAQSGSGPGCAMQAIQTNFNVPFRYYVRVRFEAFKDVVNALDGVDITLTEYMAGYAPGSYHLTGNKALAFVRARYDSDDFNRMAHGQFMLKAATKTMLKPKNWLKLPAVIVAVLRNVDTDVPLWLWPRFAFTLLRLGPDNIDNRVIKADLITPFTTNQGASVLLPNWELINPVVLEIFYGK